MARGERVAVDDVLPPVRMSPETTAALVELSALQAERATLLPAASDLAEPGAIRTARQELRTMEQQRPDTSEAGIKLLATQIQEQQGVSYKAALADAKKQLQGQMADFEARQQRLGEIDKRASALEQQVGQDAVLPRFAQAIATAGRAIETELPKPATPKESTRAAEPAAPKPAADQPTQAAPAAPARAVQPGEDVSRTAPAAAKAGLVEDAAAAARVEQVKAEAPDLMVQLDGMDSPMRVDDLLAAVKAEADDLLADGEIMQVAATCALSVGV